MSTGSTAEVVLGDGTLQVRAGFRVIDASPLAGGPIELAFFVDKAQPPAIQLAVAGDRARQRPAGFSFVATLDGVPLVNPKHQFPDLGGPAAVVAIDPAHPWHQPLLLNDFVRLEDALARLAPGATARLDILCSRTVPLTTDPAAALLAREGPRVEVSLSLSVRRDDDALAALATELAADARTAALAARLSAALAALP